MVKAGDCVAAGVSGGADSVCLLLILAELSLKAGFSLTAVHVEHGIRGEESREDAAFTEQLCRILNVPFKLCSVDVPLYREENGLSMEEAARVLRYDCFRRACAEAGADRIALGHNADDCAETMLFNLARGTGIRGMCGISPVSERTFAEEHLTVIRPLLCVTRAEIEAWLNERGQTWRTDSTNSDTNYARNRIRERVLPELGEINEKAVPHMQRLSEQLSGICGYMDEAAREAGRDVYFFEKPEDGEASSAGSVTIRCVQFLEMHPVLQTHLLLQLIGCAAGSRKDITSVHVEQVRRLMTAGVGAEVSLPGGVTAEKTYDTVVLHRKAADDADVPENVSPDTGFLTAGSDWETELAIPGETVTKNGLHFSTQILEFSDFSEKIPRKSYTKWFDYDKINSVVRLRTRRPGDYLQTDADGGHKKLNRFFIDEKIPLAERDRICLLADGEHVMWAVGYRISEAYKVTDDTRRVLCVTVNKL